jgi:hypothetical protein
MSLVVKASIPSGAIVGQTVCQGQCPALAFYASAALTKPK